jgi:hypothetical protein
LLGVEEVEALCVVVEMVVMMMVVVVFVEGVVGS